MRLTSLATLSALFLSATAPVSAQVLENGTSGIVQVSVLSGWREADGTHIAAVKFSLAPGWKTYWRAPGDGGVPLHMDWSGSTNLEDTRAMWPVPEVFRQNGLRSVGYRGEFTMPVAFKAEDDGPINLEGQLRFGVCDEICLPVSVEVHEVLSPDHSSDFVEISAALKDKPLTAQQAKIQRAECTVTYSEGHAELGIEMYFPALEGKNEALVVETANPLLWVAEPTLTRDGDTLRASTEVALRDGSDFKVDLDQLHLTVITTQSAAEVIGCS